LKTASAPDVTLMWRRMGGIWAGLIVGGGMKTSNDTGRSQNEAT